jgi:hypothetical protein
MAGEAVSAKAMNSFFLQNFGTPGWAEKVADAGGSYIRDKLRETSFARKVLPPIQVTRADLQRSTQHEGLSRIVDVEPDSRAVSINWRSQAPGRWIYADKVEFLFFSITTERYEKSEQELMSYEMPIMKIIEQNAVKDIQEVEDARFINSAEAAVSVSGYQQIKTGPAPLEKRDATNAFKMLDANRQRVDTCLMTSTLFNDILGLEFSDLGDKMASEIIVNGYAYNNFLGKKLVTTIKDNIIPNNEVWLFAPPDFMGRFYVLNNPKFYIDKRGNMVEFQAYEDIALGIKRARSVAVLRLNDNAPFPVTF